MNNGQLSITEGKSSLFVHYSFVSIQPSPPAPLPTQERGACSLPQTGGGLGRGLKSYVHRYFSLLIHSFRVILEKDVRLEVLVGVQYRQGNRSG